jgi:hypothetical protein
MNRRELGLTLSAFAMLSSIPAEAQIGATSGEAPRLVHSELFFYDKYRSRQHRMA